MSINVRRMTYLKVRPVGFSFDCVVWVVSRMATASDGEAKLIANDGIVTISGQVASRAEAIDAEIAQLESEANLS